MKHLKEGEGTNVFINDLGHMTKMAPCPYMVLVTDLNETLHEPMIRILQKSCQRLTRVKNVQD